MKKKHQNVEKNHLKNLKLINYVIIKPVIYLLIIFYEGNNIINVINIINIIREIQQLSSTTCVTFDQGIQTSLINTCSVE